jgi:hypothetical protein
MARTRKYKKVSRGKTKVTPRKDVIDFEDLVGGTCSFFYFYF